MKANLAASMNKDSGHRPVRSKLLKSVLLCLFIGTTACANPLSIRSTDTLASPLPDTPAPREIKVPVVESPALVSIEMFDEIYGWGVTETEIVRTNDGGMTWYNVTPEGLTQTGYSIGAVFLDVEHAWVQAPDMNNFPNAGWSYRTTDGGMTWASNPTPFSGGSMSCLDAGNGWMMADLGVGAGSNAVAVFQTKDGGDSWSQTYTNDPTRPGAGESLPLGGLKSSLVPVDMKAAFIGGVIYAPGAVYLYRTDDGGHTWEQANLPLPPEAQNGELAVDSLKFVTSVDGFLVMRMTAEISQQAIYVTNDGGDTWSLTPTRISPGGEADFLSAMEGIIYNGDAFYVTRDAAQTWTMIPSDIVFGDTFTDMDFVSASTGWVITYDVTGQRLLYKTIDGGATWFPVIP